MPEAIICANNQIPIQSAEKVASQESQGGQSAASSLAGQISGDISIEGVGNESQLKNKKTGAVVIKTEAFKSFLNKEINKENGAIADTDGHGESEGQNTLEAPWMPVMDFEGVKSFETPAKSNMTTGQYGPSKASVETEHPFPGTAEGFPVASNQAVSGVINPDGHAPEKVLTMTAELNAVHIPEGQGRSEDLSIEKNSVVPPNSSGDPKPMPLIGAAVAVEKQTDTRAGENGENRVVQKDLIGGFQVEPDLSVKPNPPVNPARSVKHFPTTEDSLRVSHPEILSQNNENNPSDLKELPVQSDQTSEPAASESEVSLSGRNEFPPGFQVRNIESMEHAATPSEHASISAAQAPSRVGIVPNVAQPTVQPIDQILQHVSAMTVSQAQQRISLTLTPQHLGMVRITFQHERDEVIGVLEVQKARTRREIEEALPQLVSSIQNSGIQVRRIEVVQWNSNQSAFKDAAMDDLDSSAEQEFFQQSSEDFSDTDTPEGTQSGRDGSGFSVASENSKHNDFIDSFDGSEDAGLNFLI